MSACKKTNGDNMEVKEAINKRRAYRSLERFRIDENLVKDLSESASLCCSCFNKQPWRFVFVYEDKKLKELHTSLSKGNEWVYNASMIIAVFSQKELDCVVKEREYFLFDTGMAVGMMILRATELGLVAHPIAGFDEDRAKAILNIPSEMRLITLIIVGKHSDEIKRELNEHQVEAEKNRPPRKSFREFTWINEL
jgi:nitroreductase